jgi:hypothetical protein
VVDKEFTERIRERYPEGLTAILAIGATRTTYILEHNRESETPGKITDFNLYVDTLLSSCIKFLESYLELGGQNMIVPFFSYQALKEKRGEDYAKAVVDPFLRLVTEQFQPFYHANDVDPYFAGIDTLLHLPKDQIGYQFGAALVAFQDQWPYQAGRRKLIWEVASIPLFSIWRASQVMGEEETARLEAEIESTTALDELARLLYAYYARAVYGTDIPMPHFYLGTNRNGDLKLRSMLPMALYDGGPFRLYYTPYPSLFTTPEVLRQILEDLAFGKSASSLEIDYRKEYTKASAQAEYETFITLRDNPKSTVGLLRKTTSPSKQ